MDDGAPSLEVGFLIDSGGSFEELKRLQAAMDSVEGKILADAKRIEAATGGIMQLGGATARVVGFGNAATRELQNINRDRAATEKTGEALIRQMDRQISVYGKTREEIRRNRVEAAAAAAEDQGNTDLAIRLRQREADLYAKEFAAARQASQQAEALAQDRVDAAARAIQAAEAEAAAMRGAAQAHLMFEARVRSGSIAMREAEAAAVRDAAMVERLREMLDPAAAAQDRLNREIEEARRVMMAAGASGEELARVQAMLTQRGGQVVASAGQMKAGMQQLSYNLNDMATMFAMGSSPMQIFASQAGQIIQALQLMSGEAKGLLGFLGGPWGLVLTTAAVALAPLIGKLFDTSEAAKKAEEGLKAFAKRQSDIGNFIDATTGRLTEQNRVLVQNAILTRQKAIDDNKAVIKSGQGNAFIAAKSLSEPLTGGSLWSRIKAGAALAGGGTMEMLNDPAVARVVRGAGGDLAKLDAGMQALARQRPALKATTLEISNLAGAAVLAARDNKRLGEEIAALQGRGTAGGRGMAAVIEKQVGLATATSATERAQAAYNIVKERGAAAEKAGAGALAQYRRDLTAAANAVNAAEAAEKAMRDGKSAHARATRELAAANRDADKAANEHARYQDEMGRVLDGLLRKIDPVTSAWRDYAKALLQIKELQAGGFINDGTALALSYDASQKHKRDLDEQTSNKTKGFYSDQGIDPVGDLRKAVDGIDNRRDADPLRFTTQIAGAVERAMAGGFRDIVRSMQDLQDVMGVAFGPSGPVVQKLADLAGGAAIGSSVAGAIGGSKVAGALGGAIGGEVGKQFLTKGLTSIASQLGPLAGPLGSIAGGMIASFAGSLLTSTKKASATIGAIGDQLAVIGTVGNSAKREAAATAAASGLLTSLADIADRLGGQLGGAGRVSIGIRDKDYRVDPTGGGATKVKKGAIDFGEDQQAAIEYALRDLIADGAIVGLRDATARLLNSGTDLERQMQKALDFEGVFSALKQATDPMGYAVEQLDKQFAKLRATFKEAGAAAEETAQLEQLYQIRRDAIAAQEGQRLAERQRLEAQLLEAQGDAAGALALNRKIELAGTDTSLRILKQQIYAAEDAQEAAKAASQLREAWRSVGDTILEEVKRIRGLDGASADGGFASLQGRFNAATAAARGGDQDAAKLLPGLSQSLLKAAADTATSRQELARVQAQTAASLEATYGVIGALTGAGSASPGATLSAAATAAQATAAPSSADDDLRAGLAAVQEELAAMRTDNNAGHAATASAAGRSARVLEDVSGASGGDAITIVTEKAAA